MAVATREQAEAVEELRLIQKKADEAWVERVSVRCATIDAVLSLIDALVFCSAPPNAKPDKPRA